VCAVLGIEGRTRIAPADLHLESNELAGLAKANCVFSTILHNRETPTSSAYFYFFSGQRRGPARPRDDGIKALKERPYVAAPQGKENPSQRLA